MHRHPGITVASLLEDPSANQRAAHESKIVVLAVGPDQVPGLVADIADSLKPGSLVISLAAGIHLSQLQDGLPRSCTILRALPNTGGKVGLGVTGLGLHDDIPESALNLARKLFSTLGRVLEVSDSQLDVISSLSGSGPAYFYQYVEQLASAAVKLGLAKEQADELAAYTFMGSAQNMRSTGQRTEQLLAEFSGPQTTTIKALDILEEAHLDNLLVKAAQASISRAQQISAELGQ